MYYVERGQHQDHHKFGVYLFGSILGDNICTNYIVISLFSKNWEESEWMQA